MFLKTILPAVLLLILGVAFVLLSSVSDAGISMAQRNAGIIVIILALLQMVFSGFLSCLDGKRIEKTPLETVELSAL